MLDWHKIASYFICAAVFCQSVLVIIEIYMIDFLHMDETVAQHYRIMLTALPMGVALILGFFRKPFLFSVTYFIAATLLFASSVFFPDTEELVLENALKFTLPLVVGSALCLISVNDIDIINRTLYCLSYLVFVLALGYIVLFYSMGYYGQYYDMSFSYALLLPMCACYSRKKFIPIVMSFLMLSIVILIGSRGAALFFVFYVAYDICANNKKLIIPFLAITVLLLVSVPIFAQFLDSFGIESRTIEHLLETNRSDHDSGRFELYRYMNSVLDEHLLTGIGFFGDRLYLGGYCHNLFLEILLDCGYIIGIPVIAYLIIKTGVTYRFSSHTDRIHLMRYLMATVFPLMVSRSYLIDYNFGIFIGILFIIAQKQHSLSYDTATHS